MEPHVSHLKIEGPLVFGDTRVINLIKEFERIQDRKAKECETCRGEGMVTCEDCEGMGVKGK